MGDRPQKVIDAAISQLGSPYVFGAWGEFCTPSGRRKRNRADHPTIVSACQVLSGRKSDCAGCRYQGDRMFDCRGFVHWCLQQAEITIDGQGATSQYNTASNWAEKGEIADMPECVCCVFVADGTKKSHTGLYIGGGETIECSAGVQRKTLDNRWTHYALPKGLYTAEEIAEIRRNNPKPKMVLRKGDRGEAVEYLQTVLKQQGYDCGTVDGVFGSKTVSAVKAYQYDHGLTPDGVVGAHTWAALDSAIGVMLYTVTIPHVTRVEVQQLVAQYPNAGFVAEG